MAANEAIVDVAMVEFKNRQHEGFMPALGCLGCNQETMEYVRPKVR